MRLGEWVIGKLLSDYVVLDGSVLISVCLSPCLDGGFLRVCLDCFVFGFWFFFFGCLEHTGGMDGKEVGSWGFFCSFFFFFSDLFE